MIEKKVEQIVAQAFKSLEGLQDITSKEAAGVVSEAKAQIEALIALGKQVPDNLARILELCNGGKSFLVRDFQVCGSVRGVEVGLRGSDGGCRWSFWVSDGEMIDAPKGPNQNQKVRVVVMVMPVKE